MSNWNKLEESLTLLQAISDNTSGGGGGGGDVNLTQIKGVAASTNAGFLDNATLRIATSWDDLNINAINTHLTNIENAVVPPAVLNTNQSEIAGTTTAINSGLLDNGTQRVCVATDDINLKKLIDNSSGVFPAFNIVLNGVKFGGSHEPISVASGTTDGGTLRVTLATDDVPIAQINTHLATIESDIAQIKAILTDVWDDASNALRVV